MFGGGLFSCSGRFDTGVGVGESFFCDDTRGSAVVSFYFPNLRKLQVQIGSKQKPGTSSIIRPGQISEDTFGRAARSNLLRTL